MKRTYKVIFHKHKAHEHGGEWNTQNIQQKKENV